MNKIELLSNRKAKAAWNIIHSINQDKSNNNTTKAKYKSYVKSAATLIQTNGLTQALAFWNERKGNKQGNERAYQLLLTNLSTLVSGSADLLNKSINNSDVFEYMRDTREAFSYLLWLKRFAEAEFPDEIPAQKVEKSEEIGKVKQIEKYPANEKQEVKDEHS